MAQPDEPLLGFGLKRQRLPVVAFVPAQFLQQDQARCLHGVDDFEAWPAVVVEGGLPDAFRDRLAGGGPRLMRSRWSIVWPSIA
ncbi:hypothetical protein U9R90_00365 [Streptomyces sp. E11-3]|uniref:hypothetical protein n=1 Tax=Streptomyces sp. E11-3 TaxID=3110112 RepID=UPI00397FFD93